MDIEENFYDHFSSFLPSPDDYNLDELDEILRSTGTQIDGESLDITKFTPQEAHNFEFHAQNSQLNDFNLSSVPAQIVANTNVVLPQSNSFASSPPIAEDDTFNPDDFINFLNDDFKMEQMSPDSGHDGVLSNHRGTPSPTGSCSSSIGSATSGIQSDASSIASMQDFNAANGIPKQMVMQSGVHTEVDCMEVTTDSVEEEQLVATAYQKQMPVATATALSPLALPVLSLQSNTAAPTTTTTASLVHVPTQVQTTNFSLLQGTLIPVKTMPISSLTRADIKTPAPIKIEPKLAPKAAATVTALQTPASVTATTKAAASIHLPKSTKPKTIYLSSNDFKALMQKLNSNGKSVKTGGNTNVQIPKIVLKSANGQLINGRKPATAAAVTATQFTGKSLLKSATPVVVKPQFAASAATKQEVANGTARSPAVSATPDINVYKGIVDERTLKRQQRMIKNRESASMSRKKKKEYVVSLESRINDLEKENITLKGDNNSLRSQLIALAQTCQCKNGNISDFILNSLNINATQEQPVRIASKPSAAKNIKQRMLSASVKKNIAVLFAMAFMVTLNMGGFQSYLRHDAIEGANVEATAVEDSAIAGGAAPAAAVGRRGLLWVESEEEFSETKMNRSKRSLAESQVPQVPPLHFLRPNQSETAEQQTSGDDGGSVGGVGGRSKNGGSNNKCPMSSNQTESQRLAENQRLASNLQKWIGGNDYLNLSTKFSGNNAAASFNLKRDYPQLNEYDLPLETGTAGLAQASVQRERNKLHYFQRTKLHADAATAAAEKRAPAFPPSASAGNKNSLEVFQPKISDEYMRLFQSIKRQADTFYVLSFNMDHILLPASAYNKSSRPKMSLLLPAAGDASLNGDVVLMQIDCEVVNTTELQLKSDMIPEKLRPAKYATAATNDVANNETNGRMPATAHVRSKRPLQTNDKVVFGGSGGEGVRGDSGSAVPKPYFVLKSRKDGTMATAQPHVRALNGSVVGKVKILDSHAARNLTLFQRMRETVEYAP